MFAGWKTIFHKPGGWIRYNAVDFGKKPIKTVIVRSLSSGGALQIRTEGLNGPLIAEIKIPKNKDWSIVKAPVSNLNSGVHNLVVRLKETGPVEVDWISFE